ncbi:hypothetical protein BJX66DRAFT_344175 [Aspergillus keveii]|uniref:Uncharacterized protein n=1 Tax=Aspergillus keveii TaxID=714993 RepID=A0ABR4FMM6_9EURO
MPYADRVSILSTILAFEAFEAAIATQATTTPADHVIVSLDPSKPKESLCGPDVAMSFWAEDARFKVIMHTMKFIGFIGSSDSSGFTILSRPFTTLRQFGFGALHSETCTTSTLGAGVFEPEVIPISSYGVGSMVDAESGN